MNEKVTKDDMRELTKTETEKVAGGHIPLYNDGVPYEPYKTKDEPQRDGGATGGW
jgi:hypothetical protein